MSVPSLGVRCWKVVLPFCGKGPRLKGWQRGEVYKVNLVLVISVPVSGRAGTKPQGSCT